MAVVIRRESDSHPRMRLKDRIALTTTISPTWQIMPSTKPSLRAETPQAANVTFLPRLLWQPATVRERCNVGVHRTFNPPSTAHPTCSSG
jgi:hypothetical protein